MQLDVTNIIMSKIGKAVEWSQSDFEHLSVKSSLYTLNIYPEGPNFHRVSSTTSRLRDTRLSKIGYAPNDLILTYWTWTLNHVICQRYPVYTDYLPPRPKFHSFAIRWFLFEMIAVWSFLYMTQWWYFWKKNREVKNSKSKTVLLWGPMRRVFRRKTQNRC